MMFPFQKPTSNLLILTLTFITTLLITSVNSQAAATTTTYTTHVCLGSKNDSSDSNYKSNLNNLLISASSNSSLHTFFNNTFNGIYTLYLCRADLSITSCQLCVSNATQQLQQRCPDDKSAIIWYDECWLRYSDSDFFGNPETFPRLLMYNTGNTTSPDQPNYGALALVYTLIEYAPFTDLMFGTNDSATPDGSQHRFAMVQCTRDLNSSDCGFCLGKLRDAATDCCQGKRGWRILAPSCFLRYEDLLFYQLPLPSPPPPGSNTGNGRSNTAKIVGITVSLLVLVGALLGLLYYALSCRKRRRQTDGETSQEILLPGLGGSTRNAHLMGGGIHANDHDNSSDVPYFSLAAIRLATNNFSKENKLGEGGFGPVYKGKLPDGQEIAVKRLSMTSRQGVEEFRNEVKVVAKLQHKNLVRLLGYCLDGNEKLLIYEYLANTSLDAFLFDPKRCSELDWTKRANIIHGTARGLLYLHEDSRLKVIHRDLKASNILLDDDMNPKISDFGTARIFGGNEVEANTEKVVGTYGYMAPEYALEGLISIKSDIYSFGVLMLEIISSKKNRGFYNPDHAQSLLLHAWQLWDENKGEHFIDPNIVDNCPVSDALRWIHIALLCVHDDPAERPTMSQVVLMLGSKSVNLPQLSAAPNSVFKFTSLSDQSSTSGTGTGTGFSDTTRPRGGE